MTSAALTLAVLRFLHAGAVQTTEVREDVALVVAAAEAAGVDPVVAAAVVLHESGWRRAALGRAGEVGLMQLLPRGGAVPQRPRPRRAALAVPAVNVALGVRHLAWAQAKCGGPPARWLGRYNGQPCGRSRYGAAVLAVARRLRALQAAAGSP